MPPRFAKTMIALSAALLGGCSFSAVRHGETRAVNVRLLWWTENFGFDVQTTNLNARLNLGKSVTDSDSVGAVAEGVTAGAVKGVLP